jgi:hypothetical protein
VRKAYAERRDERKLEQVDPRVVPKPADQYSSIAGWSP